MNQKSLNVKNKIPKNLFSRHLKDKKILKVFNKFKKSINVKDKFAVAVSGGPDSMSLAFLAKCYSLENNLKVKYFIVDHNLRKESSSEARMVVKFLKKININCKILCWNGKKPKSNIQSISRNKRYDLLIKECKKNNISNLMLGHHLDDLFENFFIRLIRGSGLKGLISLDKNIRYNDNSSIILRPLLDIEKKELIYLSKKVFNFFIDDPSNKNENFKRIKIRNFLDYLDKEGLNKKKFLLTINNLKDSDRSIKFYVEKNLIRNTQFQKKKNIIIINQNFFDQSHEVIFRSLSKVLNIVGKKYYPVRGKSLEKCIEMIKSNLLNKITLGGCIIEKINHSILISKEI